VLAFRFTVYESDSLAHRGIVQVVSSQDGSAVLQRGDGCRAPFTVMTYVIEGPSAEYVGSATTRSNGPRGAATRQVPASHAGAGFCS
jgi:hypothetical protein